MEAYNSSVYNSSLNSPELHLPGSRNDMLTMTVNSSMEFLLFNQVQVTALYAFLPFFLSMAAGTESLRIPGSYYMYAELVKFTPKIASVAY